MNAGLDTCWFNPLGKTRPAEAPVPPEPEIPMIGAVPVGTTAGGAGVAGGGGGTGAGTTAATTGAVMECSPPRMTGNLPRLTISAVTRRISAISFSGRTRVLIEIVLPAAAPYLLAGLRLAAGRAQRRAGDPAGERELGRQHADAFGAGLEDDVVHEQRLVVVAARGARDRAGFDPVALDADEHLGRGADELFAAVFSRRPTADERKDVADALTNTKDRQTTINELVWIMRIRLNGRSSDRKFGTT